MPPYLAMPYFHLSKLPLTTKVGLTMFYLSLVSGFVFVGLSYYPMVSQHAYDQSKNMLGKDLGAPDAYRDHFAPQELTREVMKKQGAPEADIEQAARDQREGQKRKASDIVHPHSFLMPVIFFILIHLMEMTTLWQKAKIPLYVTTGACMILTVFAPLIVLSAPGLALPCFGAMYVMLLCFTAMALGPLYPMWFVKT
jgi:hypothetical protein